MLIQEFFPDIYDMLQMLIVIYFGWVLTIRLSHFLNVEQGVGQSIFIWHFLLSITFFIYSLNFVSDATSYYEASFFMDEKNYESSTKITYAFYDFLITSLSLSYLGISSLAGVIGTIGLIFLYAMLREISHYKKSTRKYIIFLVFLPSLSFWTGGLGKDGLVFLFINLILWSNYDYRNRLIIMIVSTIALFLFRPHIAIPMFALTLFGSYLTINIKPKIKKLLGVIIVILASIIALYGLKTIGLSSNVFEFIQERMILTEFGESAFNLKDKNIFAIITNFLFFPIFIEQISIKYIPLITEGVVILLVSLIMIFKNVVKGRGPYPKDFYLILLIFLVILIALSLSLSNYGLLFRQKIMLLPLLFYLVFFSRKKSL